MLSIPGSPGVLRVAAKEVLRQPSVLACALVDVESGLTLDAETADRARLDTEAVAAAQAEVIRAAQALAQVVRGAPAEVVVRQGSAVLHLIRLLPDPAGPGLVLSVLVLTPERNLRKVRRVLDRVDPATFVPRRPRATSPVAAPGVTAAPDAASWSPEDAPVEAAPAVPPAPAAAAPGAPAHPGAAAVGAGAPGGAPARPVAGPALVGTTVSPAAGRATVPPVPAWAGPAGAPAGPARVGPVPVGPVPVGAAGTPGPTGALLTARGRPGAGPDGPNGARPAAPGTWPAGSRPRPSDGRFPAPVTAVDLARLVPASPGAAPQGPGVPVTRGPSGAGDHPVPADPTGGAPDRSDEPAATPSAARNETDRGESAPGGTHRSPSGGSEADRSTSEAVGTDAPELAGLADRPGLSAVDWFSPVTPGSPPPLRRTVAGPEESHTHVGLPHRS
ncbi:hypothetical protein ACQP04_17130 [Pseudonocardia halophobica]|uniref:hypothetical protein n=1 Tax=Pseudonocardia halophobica TaxID=29401 RepID=UPI003D8D9AEF